MALLVSFPQLSWALHVKAEISKTTVAPGEEFEINITLTNETTEEKIWNYSCKGIEELFSSDNPLVLPAVKDSCSGPSSKIVLNAAETTTKKVHFKVLAKTQWPEFTSIYVGNDGHANFRIGVVNPDQKMKSYANPLSVTIQEPV